MSEWMAEHPHTTLEEIEEALDGHIMALRAQMLEDCIFKRSQQES